VYVVVPSYGEATVVGDQVRALLGIVRHVVVVDGGSSDETGAAALKAGAVVLRHVLNRGQGAALQTGIRYALEQGARYVVTFDADGQHSPASVTALLGPLAQGRAEVTLGSRFLGDAGAVPPLRRTLLRAAVVFTRITSGARVTDAHNGLRAFTRRAASSLDLRQDRMAHASEIIEQVHRSGLPYVEVPVRIEYTAYSVAKGQRGLSAFRIVSDYLVGKWFG
jgi:glycosyltransferase involved in cell wall biosynthesis